MDEERCEDVIEHIELAGGVVIQVTRRVTTAEDVITQLPSSILNVADMIQNILAVASGVRAQAVAAGFGQEAAESMGYMAYGAILSAALR